MTHTERNSRNEEGPGRPAAERMLFVDPIEAWIIRCPRYDTPARDISRKAPPTAAS